MFVVFFIPDCIRFSAQVFGFICGFGLNGQRAKARPNDSSVVGGFLILRKAQVGMSFEFFEVVPVFYCVAFLELKVARKSDH